MRLLLLFLLFLSFDALALGGVYFLLPDTRGLLKNKIIVRTNIDGHPHPIKIDPSSTSYIRLDHVPKHLRYAVILLEDAKFYQHRGFDHSQIYRALKESTVWGRRLRGASTISQQLVKNLYLSNDRSFKRKVMEAMITLKLELQVPKERILELYLNSIDWGKNLIGIHSASRFYFHKNVSEIGIREAAFLSAIIPNPARFGATPDKLYVRKRVLTALERLYRAGIIDIDKYRRSLFEGVIGEEKIDFEEQDDESEWETPELDVDEEAY